METHLEASLQILRIFIKWLILKLLEDKDICLTSASNLAIIVMLFFFKNRMF